MLKQLLLISAVIGSSFPLLAQFDTSPERLEKHVYILASDSLLGRGFGTEQGAIAAKYIAQQFMEAGLLPLNGTYFHPFNHRSGILNISGINVAGIIPGNDPNMKEEYIVLGAHYDHLGWKIKDRDTVVYNGADDNASGTASIIEIGRNLADLKKSLGRSIILVAFDGEESGLVGSRRFLADSVVPVEKIRLMFSLDMVGMYEAHKGLDMAGVKLLSNADEITGKLATENNIIIKKANSSIGQRTDTAPFGESGIPAIHTFTGSESPYHKPEDIAGELDYEGMAKVANFISASALLLSSAERISDMEPREPGVAETSGTKIFRPGLRLRVGSGYHNYKSEFYEGKSIMAAEGGVFASIRAASFITIQPEVVYETRGSQHPDGTFRTHAITVPLNLFISSPDDGMVQTYFLFGGYYSYHFGGKVGNATIEYQDIYDDQEFGLSYGFGFQVMNIQIGLNIRNGLSSIFRDDATGSVTNKGVSFSLGYLF